MEGKTYYEKWLEKRDRDRIWKETHPGYHKAWRAAHANVYRDYQKKWRETNPGYQKAWREEAHFTQYIYRDHKKAQRKKVRREARRRKAWHKWFLENGYGIPSLKTVYRHKNQEAKLFTIGSFIARHSPSRENIQLVKIELAKCFYVTCDRHSVRFTRGV